MRKAQLLALPILAAVALIGLSACGGGGGSSTTPPPNPTPSSSGLNIYPPTASVPAGGEAIFIGYVPSNSTATVTWAVTGGATNGTITTNASGQGVYTAPTSVPSPAQVAITAASSGFSGTAVVTITSAQGVAVSPAVASVDAGSQTVFAASMNGAAANVTSWEVNGTQGGDGVHGTIDTNGNYTAPLTPPPGGSTVITAVVGATSGNSTVTVVYANASFNGAYAFSYTGDDGTGYLAVAGNLNANSISGTITGTEDLLDGNGITSGQSVNGTYSIGPDGRGPVTLSTGEVWQIALSSNQHALMVNFNSSATGSGTIDQQTTTTEPFVTPQQHYVFQLAGLDVNGNPVGIAGAFTSLGNGAIQSTGNVIDINDGGSAGSNTENSVDDTSLTGSFILSPGAPAPGALSLTSNEIGETLFDTTSGSLLFDFYIVSPSHAHLIETDGNAFLSGDVYLAPTPGNAGYVANLFGAGGYAFTMGGATSTGPYGAGGVLVSGGGSSTTSTSGSTTGGVFDNNAPGLHSQNDAAIKSGSYAVDATTGRVSLSSVTTSAGSFNLVGYVAAPDPTTPDVVPPVVLLDVDANVIASGTAYLQSGETTPSGSFALNLSGVGASGASNGAEQDILGALNISGTTISGTVDINNFEVNGESLGINVSSGSAIVSVDTNGRGTATIKGANGATFQLVYYDVDPNTVLLLDTDTSRVAVGILLKQF